MSNLDAALKRYYRSIHRELPCSFKMKKRIMQQIYESVNLFLEQNPTADFETVQSHFGEPQTIALSYVEDQDAPALLRKMRIKKIAIAIVAVTMALVLVSWIAAMTWAIINEQQAQNGHTGERVETIE